MVNMAPGQHAAVLNNETAVDCAEATNAGPSASTDTAGGPRDFTSASPSGRRLAFLDVLRAFAALSVCFQHTLEQSPHFRAFSRGWLNLGVFGVVVFFIISGFIIPASLEKYGSLRRFWKARLLRIYPMYLVVLAATIAIQLAHHQPLCGTHPAGPCAVANTTLFQEFLKFPSIVGVAWTLGLEMIFYVLCSALFVLGWYRSPAALTFMAIAGFGLLNVAGGVLHHSIPVGRVAMLVFAFYGLLVFNVDRKRVSVKVLWLASALLLPVLLYADWSHFHFRAELDSFGEIPFRFTNVAISWFSAIAAFFVVYRFRHLSWPSALQWTGRVSYSFYLLADVFPLVLPVHRPLVLWFLFQAAAVLLISAITYRYIERPFMHLGAMPRPAAVPASAHLLSERQSCESTFPASR